MVSLFEDRAWDEGVGSRVLRKICGPKRDEAQKGLEEYII